MSVKINQKPRETKVSKLATMLGQLSDKDLKIVESVINSASEKVTSDQFSILDILSSQEAKDLINLAKRILDTQLTFKLSEMKNLSKEISLHWELEEDIAYYMRTEVQFDRSNLEKYGMLYYVSQHLEELHSENGEEMLDEYPTKIKQEMKAAKKAFLKTIDDLPKKKFAVKLNELACFQTPMTVSFGLDEYWYNSLPFASITVSTKTNSYHLHDLADLFADTFWESEASFSDTLAEQTKEIKNLTQDLVKRTQKLAKQYKLEERGYSIDDLGAEILLGANKSTKHKKSPRN